MTNSNYYIATLSDTDKQNLSEMESKFNQATGKDYVLIAWQKEN